MPNIDSPKGFKPTGTATGAPYSGSVNEYRIASGTAANIFTGDLVKLLATGFVTVAGAAEQFRGVALGFRWVGADGVPVYKNYWPSGTVTLGGQDAVVTVADDDRLVLEAKFTGAATHPTNADVGLLFDISTATAGSAITGQSGQGVAVASGAATLKQLRFEGFVQSPDNDVAAGASAYARGRFTPVNHDRRVQTGI